MCEPKRLTEADGISALRDHLRDKALAARARHLDIEGPGGVEAFLADPDCVRYPTTLVWSAEALQPREFAWIEALGEVARDGFRLHIHPLFREEPALAARLVAYQVVRINYGEIAGPEEAEHYGATLFGCAVDDYYDELCRAADRCA